MEISPLGSMHHLDLGPYLSHHKDFKVDPFSNLIKPLKEHLLDACQKMFQTIAEFFSIEQLYIVMMSISTPITLNRRLGQEIFSAMLSRLQFDWFKESPQGHATYLALALGQNVHVRYDNGFQPIEGGGELQNAVLKRFGLWNGSLFTRMWEVTFVFEDLSEKPVIGTFDALKTLFSFTGQS